MRHRVVAAQVPCSTMAPKPKGAAMWRARGAVVCRCSGIVAQRHEEVDGVRRNGGEARWYGGWELAMACKRRSGARKHLGAVACKVCGGEA